MQWAVAKVYDGSFSEIGGAATSLSANEDAVGLPADTWGLETYTVEEYEAQLAAIKDGSLAIDDQFPENAADISFPNVKMTVV